MFDEQPKSIVPDIFFISLVVCLLIYLCLCVPYSAYVCVHAQVSINISVLYGYIEIFVLYVVFCQLEKDDKI